MHFVVKCCSLSDDRDYRKCNSDLVEVCKLCDFIWYYVCCWAGVLGGVCVTEGTASKVTLGFFLQFSQLCNPLRTVVGFLPMLFFPQNG